MDKTKKSVQKTNSVPRSIQYFVIGKGMKVKEVVYDNLKVTDNKSKKEKNRAFTKKFVPNKRNERSIQYFVIGKGMNVKEVVYNPE